MDLSQLDTQKGANLGHRLSLTHPKTGDMLDCAIHIFGADSAVYQTALREQQRQARERFSRQGKVLRTPEEDAIAEMDLLIAATGGWDGIELDDAVLPFTPDNARMLYGRFAWIREQVDRAINDRAHFLPDAAKV